MIAEQTAESGGSDFTRGKVASWSIVISSLIAWFIVLFASLIFLPPLLQLLGASYDVAWELSGIMAYASLLAITLGFITIDGDWLSIVEMLRIKSVKSGMVLLFALPLAITIVDNLAVMAYAEFFEMIFGHPDILDVDYPEYEGLPLALAFISTVIAAPVIEEIMFRGYVLDAIRKIHGDVASVLGSAVIFGILHIDSYVAGMAAVGGIIYGWIRIKTGSLWPSLISHVIWNGIFFYVTYFL